MKNKNEKKIKISFDEQPNLMLYVEKPKRTKAEFRDCPNVHVACGLMPSRFSKDD